MDIFNLLVEMFQYPFLIRAMVVGVLVSLCASLLGVSLVLKRYSMIGDGLSHVGFGALAIAMVLGTAPLWVAIPVVLIAAFILLRISENGKIKGDAAIALISSSSLAIGVMLISLTSGMNTDVVNFMFGSILSLTEEEARLSMVISVGVIILFVYFYPRIFAITFDETFAKSTGMKVRRIDFLLAGFTAITIVLGMRMMGALLISSLIIFPSLSSMRVFKTFRGVTVSSAILSVSSFMIGMVVSYGAETPTGASIVCVNLWVFILFTLIGLFQGRLRKEGASMNS